MKRAAGSQRTTLPAPVVRKLSLLVRVGKHFLAAVILTCILILGVIPAFGQMNTAEISGLVKDPSGATVANATIDAVEAGTQLKYTTASNASGEFLLAQLPVGEYKLTVIQPSRLCRLPSIRTLS